MFYEPGIYVGYTRPGEAKGNIGPEDTIETFLHTLGLGNEPRNPGGSDVTIELRHHIDDSHIGDLMTLYRQTYWAKDRREVDVRRMLQRTDLVFALVDTDSERLVGFARVLTDTVYKAFVFDVMVHPEYRGRGLSGRLLTAITSHPELETVKHFELYCRSDVVELYRKWGFGTELGGQIFMRREGKPRG